MCGRRTPAGGAGAIRTVAGNDGLCPPPKASFLAFVLVELCGEVSRYRVGRVELTIVPLHWLIPGSGFISLRFPPTTLMSTFFESFFF